MQRHKEHFAFTILPFGITHIGEDAHKIKFCNIQHRVTCRRRKWQPTPVFLPGEYWGQRTLVGCRLWGHIELDMTEAT